MRFLLIAVTMQDAMRHDMLTAAAVLTPRSPHGARGVTGVQELRVTPAMLEHPSLPLLLDLARPCFATTPRETL